MRHIHLMGNDIIPIKNLYLYGKEYYGGTLVILFMPMYDAHVSYAPLVKVTYYRVNPAFILRKRIIAKVKVITWGSYRAVPWFA